MEKISHNIYIYKLKRQLNNLGKKASKVLFAVLIMLQSFIGYIPMTFEKVKALDVTDEESLKTNLEAAGTGDTLILQKELTIDTTITVGAGDFTIDLNGNNIISSKANTLFNIANPNTNLTIKNSQDTEANIKFTGSGLGNAITVTGAAKNSVLNIDKVKFSDFKKAWGGVLLINGSAGAEPTIKITNSTFENNQASSMEGGALSFTNAKVELTGNIFKNNIAKTTGGVINASNSDLTLTDNTFSENTAYTKGGAINATKNSILKIYAGNNFNSNKASSGGAISTDNSNVTIESSKFDGNKAISSKVDSQYKAQGDGGAIYLQGEASAANKQNPAIYNSKISNNEIINNSSNSNGGAIWVSAMTNNFTHNKISNNTISSVDSASMGTSGGGIYSYDCNDTYIDNEITYNKAINGGGIYYSVGLPYVTSSKIEDKKKELNLENNHINYNTAINENIQECENGKFCGMGGGLSVSVASSASDANITADVKVNLKSGEFIGNHATDGGAIYLGIHWSKSNLALKKVLITGNKAGRGGGIWLCPTARTEMHSTLGGAIYGNTASGDPEFGWGDGQSRQTLNSAGDDIFYEGTKKTDQTDKQFGPNEDGTNVDPNSSLTVTSRTWSGNEINWYKDEHGNRYVDGTHHLFTDENDPYLVGADGNGTKNLTALHGLMDEDPYYNLTIKDNIADRRGGGIFTNNTVNIGENKDIDVKVNKEFFHNGEKIEKDLPEIYVNLYQIDKNGNETLLEENVALNSYNDYSHTFYNLPTVYSDNEADKYTYDVREVNPTTIVETNKEADDEGNITVNIKNIIVDPTEYSLEVEKIISGDMPKKQDTFTFEIESEKQTGMELPKNLKTTIKGEGKTKFDNIKFTLPGTYTFKVKEIKGDDIRYNYDNSIWTVTINVVKNKTKDELEIDSVSFIKNNKYYKGVQFNNIYTDIVNPKTGDDIFFNIFTLIISSLTMGVFLITTRRKLALIKNN